MGERVGNIWRTRESTKCGKWEEFVSTKMVNKREQRERHREENRIKGMAREINTKQV